jgi:hypothetical protein
MLGTAPQRNSSASLTFAALGNQSEFGSVARAPSQGAAKMNERFSLLSNIDQLCGQFAAALHNAEWQVYATLALIIVLSALLFPPKDDPDQI